MRKTSFTSKKMVVVKIVTQVKNLFFRNNNLLAAYIKAYRHNNRIIIAGNSNLYNCKINLVGGVILWRLAKIVVYGV